MRVLLFMILISLLPACAQLIKNDNQRAADFRAAIAAGEYRDAYDDYQHMSPALRKRKSVREDHQRLQGKLAQLRKNTAQQAEQQIRKGRWRRAIDLYESSLDVIEIDPAFKKQYEGFLVEHQQAKQGVTKSYLVSTAHYLVEVLPVLRAVLQIDPYNSRLEYKLKDLEEEKQQIAAQLLKLGEQALVENDINTARILLPLAHRLQPDPNSKKALEGLQKITQPLNQHIASLTQQAMNLYSREEYAKALLLWNEILYLDPGNNKVIAHKKRTEKIIESLEAIKTEQ